MKDDETPHVHGEEHIGTTDEHMVSAESFIAKARAQLCRALLALEPPKDDGDAYVRAEKRERARTSVLDALGWLGGADARLEEGRESLDLLAEALCDVARDLDSEIRGAKALKAEVATLRAEMKVADKAIEEMRRDKGKRRLLAEVTTPAEVQS